MDIQEFTHYCIMGIWQQLDMEMPSNHDEIVDFCVKDMKSSCGEDWIPEDIKASFKNWVEQNN